MMQRGMVAAATACKLTRSVIRANVAAADDSSGLRAAKPRGRNRAFADRVFLE